MKRLLLIIFLVVVAVGISYIVEPAQLNGPQQEQVQDDSVVVSEDYVRYPGEDGRTALELLEELVAVEKKEYSFGVFIESIGGVEPQDGFFWKLYINGQESQVGAGQLQTKDGEVIEWKIEAIEF